MNAKTLIVIVSTILVASTVAIALAAVPQCATAYCIRNDNAATHNVGVSGTLFDARTKSAGYWLIWLDTDGSQTSITVTGYNLASAWLPSLTDVTGIVPNPSRLPDPSNFDVVAVPGGNITITGRNGRLIPKEFLLGIHGLNDTLWGVLGSVSALPTLVPTATPLATVTPVPTATALPTLAPPATVPAPTATP